MVWAQIDAYSTYIFIAEHGAIKSEHVRTAMLAVDRGDFAPSHPYDDSPQGIGHGATISAPHMVCVRKHKLSSYVYSTAKHWNCSTIN
jgi:protein-L-isoaspartate(D-aspartate) O-methyltransferase